MSDEVLRTVKLTNKILALRGQLSSAKGFFAKRRIRREIKATEGIRQDVLISEIVQTFQSAQKFVDKNNFKDYPGQVENLYRMYLSQSDYGAGLARPLVDTRTAFIAGEGLTVISEKPETQAYIDRFVTLNRLNGSGLIEQVKVSEMEGKNFIRLIPKKAAEGRADVSVFGNLDRIGYIKLSSFSWRKNKYEVEEVLGDPVAIRYNTKGDISRQATIPIDTRAVFIKTGGVLDEYKNTPTKIHSALSYIENFDRAYFDQRKNAHLNARLTPYWKTSTAAEGKAILNDVEKTNWKIGQSYAGSADFSLVGTGNSAADLGQADIVTSLKISSSITGIPVHLLAWPDLLSNRATAENMLEAINNAIAAERLIWEEGLSEMITKSMILAIDNGIEDNSIVGPFEVKLPAVSIALLNQIASVWIPLFNNGLIDDLEVQNRIPGINPSLMRARIEEQKIENRNALKKEISNELSSNEDAGINSRTGKTGRVPRPV